MKRKEIIIALVLSLSALSASKAVLITDFSQANFTIDYGTSSIGYVISANTPNISVEGMDSTQMLAGTFDPVDVSGSFQIILTGTVSGDNPNASFHVDLYNSDFSQVQTYTGYTEFFGSTSTSIVLTFDSGTAFSDIAGFVFTLDGPGTLSFTFQGLSAEAVPEPSTYALMAAGLGGLFFALRLRKART